MTRLLSSVLALIVLAASHATVTQAQVVAEPQSNARPFGLPIHGPVFKLKSDQRSTNFYNNEMRVFQGIIEDKLAESARFSGREGFKLDPARLYLRTVADESIRVYFLAEGAGYHNSLGFSWIPAGSDASIASVPKVLIFPDASARSGSTRTSSEPLKAGDFIDLGFGDNGIQLDFFLISNGANGGQQWLWNDYRRNPDGLQHMVAFMIPDSRFILLGFEDIIGGGDLDYNDSLFVVDIGEENAENLLEIQSTLPH
mgnify:CR=1 FL=1